MSEEFELVEVDKHTKVLVPKAPADEPEAMEMKPEPQRANKPKKSV